ncbi:MAG: class I SAM-dependent methyltransferase [Solirubrobacteraceae bacterium]
MPTTAKALAKTALFSAARLSYSHSLSTLLSRGELPHLLNRRGLVNVGAEIGVERGTYSDILLDRWQGRRLISIDPWLKANDEWDDTSNVSPEEHETRYQETLGVLRKFGSRSDVWRLTGSEASQRVEDGSLDFVYIDARHDYESVREDVTIWWAKVKQGGICAGHDYIDGQLATGSYGVKQAVDEFFARQQLAVHHTIREKTANSWLVLKP